jgi:hypothetical protein
LSAGCILIAAAIVGSSGPNEGGAACATGTATAHRMIASVVVNLIMVFLLGADRCLRSVVGSVRPIGKGGIAARLQAGKRLLDFRPPRR